MQPALDRVVVDLAFRQRHLGVRAHVPQRVDLALRAGDGDRLAVHVDADHALDGQIGQCARPAEHRCLGHSERSSSASTASAILIRSSGTSMVSISWPKNPRMTSLRASSNGMPRAIR